ncbi:SDR family oxidoreductase [Waterburya agarophytonicola K14]|uniref:SDR family oxidoreductase n=1 Tax=Waterburya agarophytonicola KI4 TaxID=2874699 RepID=A0A964FGV0_9CYAN|nr:SDR family oxidoreductase [Waterburya agarophytonicola]MCC0176863.1 SDR family oxidoreductase [Waterburya agarophytonicola KI4]
MNQKRVALVTGSTSGIGLAIAKRFIEDGFTIVFHSKSSVETGEQLAQFYPDAAYIRADLSDQKQARDLIAEVLSRYGGLDILVNNAGITKSIPHKDLQAATPEIWREIHEVNVIAPWTLITEAEAALRESSCEEYSSCIINITSHAGIRPKGASIPYAVSKASLNHVTKLLAVSLAPAIRVNAIAPGLVETPMSKGWVAARKLWQERSPMKRGAQPEDIAQIALMLIQSNYLTGEIIIADGGLNLT